MLKIVFVLLAVGATVAVSGDPTLSQVVTCNGPKPEFKDAVEAATRNRVGSGYVSLSGRDGAGFPTNINVVGIGRALLLDTAFGDIVEEACRSGRKSAECQKIRFETDSGFAIEINVATAAVSGVFVAVSTILAGVLGWTCWRLRGSGKANERLSGELKALQGRIDSASNALKGPSPTPSAPEDNPPPPEYGVAYESSSKALTYQPAAAMSSSPHARIIDSLI